MNQDQNAELLELVHTLMGRVEALELEVKSIRLERQEVPEEVLIAIAAAVAAYLGVKPPRRQASFTRSQNWTAETRELQHAHIPLHLR